MSGFSRSQQNRTTRRFVAALLILLSIIIVLADKQRQASINSGRLTLDDPSAKVLGVLSIPARGIGNLFRQAGDRANAYEENIRLKAEVERLRGIENKVLDLQTRISQYEAILTVGDNQQTDTQKIAARAVFERNGPFVHSALINAGRLKNVKPGHAVMTVDGFYGHVVRVGKNSARVLLPNDLNSRISVMSRRSGSRAIMVGVNTKRPALRFIASGSDWKDGDMVVTSGDGGVLPAGLPIGVAAKGKKSNYTVVLNTEDKPIDWVWVTPFEPIKAPIAEDVTTDPQADENQ